MDDRPLLLRQAVVTLYPADASGNPLTAQAVWCGAVANDLRLGFEFEEQLSFTSGDRYRTAHHADENHALAIGRTWVIRYANPGEAAGPQRGARYVLEIVWRDDGTGYWFRRVYYGVTGRSADLVSQGARQHDHPQTYRAEYFTQTGGQGAPGIFTPTTSTTGEQLVGFFGENPLLVDTYLLGVYRFSTAKRITAVRHACWSPQAETTLTLELDGGLTAHTVTLPAGTANTDATGSATLDVSVPAGTEVRWRVTAGPGAEDAAWHLGLVLTLVEG